MTPNDDAPDRTLTFHDSYAPALTGGPYTMTVRHQVEGLHGPLGDPETDFPTVTRHFEVQAPRFSLAPGSVHAMHPPPGAEGNYDTHLAHVSLTRAMLPWEQELEPDQGNGTRTPWLALLLFAEGELPGDPHAQGKAQSRAVRELLTPQQGDVLGPHIENVSDESLGGTCRTIDVPTDLFLAVVPREEELASLAHVREVTSAPSRRAAGGNDAGDGTAGDTEDEITDDPPGLYAVVLGNRFPRIPGYYAAHLVSLEGFARCLRPGADRPERDFVRLAALASWSFTSHPDARGHFRDVVAALAADGRQEPEGWHLALRVPPPQADGSPEAGEISDRLTWGYAPLPQLLPTGERSFGWYRGPLSPVPQPPVPGLDADRSGGAYRGDSPDGLLVYAPDWGVFDLSYAAAWTLGRLLALSHASARTAVSRLWQRARATAIPALSRLDAPADLSGFDARAMADAGAAASPAVDHFHRLLAEGLPQRLARRPAQSADPPAAAQRADASTSGARKERLRTLLRQEAVRARLTEALAEPAAPVAGFLDALRTLELVPFDHLVADPRMLPPESLRFFHVDAAWVAALVDGALSAGVSTSADRAVSGIVREAVASRPGAGQPPPAAGLLMRSRLARDWPGLIVDATRNGAAVDTVRRDRLAPDVLLVLFDAVPDTVTIGEPHQDVYVGVSHTGDRYVMQLRAPDDRDGPVGEETGRTFPAAGDPGYQQGLDFYLRRQPPGAVLDLARLARPLAAALGIGEVTPSGLAVQLIVSPAEQSFVQPPHPAPAGPE